MLICELKSSYFPNFGNIILLGHILLKCHLKRHMQALTENKTNLIQKHQNHHAFADHRSAIQVLSTPTASELHFVEGVNGHWSCQTLP